MTLSLKSFFFFFLWFSVKEKTELGDIFLASLRTPSPGKVPAGKMIVFGPKSVSTCLRHRLTCLTGLHFVALHRHLFLQTEGSWPLCIKQVFWCPFPNSICLLQVSVSHFDSSCKILNFFVSGDLCSVISTSLL